MSDRNIKILRTTSVALILFAAATRFIPHPFNFTGMGAMALFAGATIADRRIAFLLPFFAMAITDLYFGFHFSILPVYLCFACIVWMGTRIKDLRPAKIGIGSVASSILFFLVTNLPFWYADLSLYSLDLKGTMQSYTMALPFFWNQLAGDLFYNGILFGVYYLIRKSILKAIPIRY
jgi:hypothetical protein